MLSLFIPKHTGEGRFEKKASFAFILRFLKFGEKTFFQIRAQKNSAAVISNRHAVQLSAGFCSVGFIYTVYSIPVSRYDAKFAAASAPTAL